MAEEKKKGYWFTTETGKHVYVEEGQTPKEATEKALANAKSAGESKKAKELGIHKDTMKKVSESEMSDKEFEISEALSDFSWQITDDDTADSFAESVANKLGYSKDEVLAVMKKENPKLTPETKIANIVSGESDDKLKAYQFPELTKEDLIKAKEYGLSYKAQFKDGDMVLIGTQQQLKDFANDYLAYELVDDYLTNDEDFDYEDLAEQGELTVFSKENYQKINGNINDDENEKHDYELDALRNRDEQGLNNDDEGGYLDPRTGEIVSKSHFEKYVKPHLTKEQLAEIYEDDEKNDEYDRLQKIVDERIKQGWDRKGTHDPQSIKDTGYLGYGSLEALEKATFSDNKESLPNDAVRVKNMETLANAKSIIRQYGYDPDQEWTDGQIDDIINQLEKEQSPENIIKGQNGKLYDRNSGKEVVENQNEKIINAFKSLKSKKENNKNDDEFVPMEYYEPSEQQKAYGLTKYDIQASVDEYNKTKGGRLIPHEDTIKDLKQDIDWDLYDNEDDLEKGINSILGGKYLTKEEKQQVHDYFKQKNPPIETKKYDEVENKKVRKVASTIDAEIAKSLPRLYRDGFAGTQLSKDGDYNVLTFYAELGYDGMEKVMDKLDAKLKEMGIDAYFEMETSGRAIAYFK